MQAELLNVKKILDERDKCIYIFKEESKKKDILLNNKNSKIDNLTFELDEIKLKNKQHNMVSLLTKLKNTESKVPIIVEKMIEENTNNIKFPETSKALLVKRRKRII